MLKLKKLAIMATIIAVIAVLTLAADTILTLGFENLYGEGGSLILFLLILLFTGVLFLILIGLLYGFVDILFKMSDKYTIEDLFDN